MGNIGYMSADTRPTVPYEQVREDHESRRVSAYRDDALGSLDATGVAEEIRAKVVRHVNSCFFTMVAIDDEGKPVAVPPLTPSTPDEHRRYAAAQVRREMRREMERRFSETRQAQE